MTRSLLAAGLALVVGLMLASGTPTAAQPADDPRAKAAAVDEKFVNQVEESIKKGVEFLRKVQDKDGGWESTVVEVLTNYKGGTTGLATLALLNCGERPDDPTVARGLQYLEKLDPSTTYVRALQTMALAETRLERYKPRIEKNVRWFQENAVRSGGKLKGWGYPDGPGTDNSNTQYALLALYAAKTAGVRVDDQLWRDIIEYYGRSQKTGGDEPGGYWDYGRGTPVPSFTMTVGGVCGLLIANMGLGRSEQELNEQTGVAARCGQYAENDALALGMRWVAAKFNFVNGKSVLYNYYGIERLGRLSGQRFIGRYDWYREGCERLVGVPGRHQSMQYLGTGKLDGSFAFSDTNRGGIGVDDRPVVATSFALLFLSKGRTPVLMTKFAWGGFRKADAGTNAVLTELDADGRATTRPDWNRKHNDARNVVEFASREVFDGRPLSWQVYDSRLQDLSTDAQIDVEVGFLLQSPVLYLNGHGGRLLSDRQELVLKRYLEAGGFVFAEACCGDKAFADAFRAMMDRVLNKPDALQPVPAEHAVWTMFPGVGPGDFPDLQYVQHGCRTVAVFSPAPLAGYWEESRLMPSKVEARDPKTRGHKAYCLARNVIAYATGMELPKPKLSFTRLPSKVTETEAATRSKFRALQLKYAGTQGAEAPPAAGALRNLMDYLERNAKLDVAQAAATAAPGDEGLARYKFMYLHGRKPLALTDDEANKVKANLQSGGLLLADAACGGFAEWKKFDASFRAEMKRMWGADLEAIPPTRPDGTPEPLFKIAKAANIDLGNVRCRRVKPDGSGPEQEMRTYPVLLEGIKDETGRWMVVYSKYDLGCAIEGHKAADCMGYDKDSALRIASAVVLYSLKR
jgi:hypothetical protein